MLSTLLAAAAVSGALDLSDRTELRLRDPGSLADTVSFDIATAPRAELTLSSRRTTLRLSYVPEVTLWDLNVAPSPPVLMQQASALGEWRHKLGRLSLEQSGSYGDVNYASLTFVPGPAGAPPRVDVVPASQVIHYMSSTSVLSTDLNLRRWRLGLRGGYQVLGGADTEARAILPLQSGPFGEGLADFALSRRADLRTTLSAAELSFSNGPESVLVTAREGWHHAWSRTTRTELTAGVTEARSRPDDRSTNRYQTFPVGELALEQSHLTAGDRVVVRVGAGVSPTVNQLYGNVDERVEGTVRATWTHRRLALTAYASAQQSVPTDGDYAVQLLAGELSATYDTGGVVSFDGGVRAIGQRANEPPPPGSGVPGESSFVQGIVFLGVTLRAPKLRF